MIVNPTHKMGYCFGQCSLSCVGPWYCLYPPLEQWLMFTYNTSLFLLIFYFSFFIHPYRDVWWLSFNILSVLTIPLLFWNFILLSDVKSIFIVSDILTLNCHYVQLFWSLFWQLFYIIIIIIIVIISSMRMFVTYINI